MSMKVKTNINPPQNFNILVFTFSRFYPMYRHETHSYMLIGHTAEVFICMKHIQRNICIICMLPFLAKLYIFFLFSFGCLLPVPALPKILM